MRIKPEISSVSVVLLGNFNPAIFTPAWFALHGLLPEGAADNAELQVAHPTLTMFSTEWLQFEATTDRFLAVTQSAPNIRIRDFVARVFGEHLFHTPVNALGVNRDVHFRAPSQRARDQVGRVLAPVDPWLPCVEKLGLALDSEYGGMRSLTMVDTRPEGRPLGGQVQVTVEPSVRIDNGRSGIYVSVNDHYAANSADAKGNAQLLAFLENDFDSSIRRSDAIIDHIMSLAKEEGVRAS